jgi:putative tryptophan/tyrosine transport system substrate-binding protein
VYRRAFIGTLAGGLLAGPLAVMAQGPTKIPRVGFLSPSSLSDPRTARYFQAFRQGLREARYVEGQNIVIESRWAEGNYNRLPALAAELVRLNSAVIVTYGGAATEATRQATGTIPIVMAVVQEAVSTGLVSSLAHPGGNITGTSSMSPELVQKELQILKEVVPNVSG